MFLKCATLATAENENNLQFWFRKLLFSVRTSTVLMNLLSFFMERKVKLHKHGQIIKYVIYDQTLTE